MKIKIKKVDGLIVPTRANPNDYALDITAISDPIIIGDKFEIFLDGINGWKKIDMIQYKTNLFISPQDEIKDTIKKGVTSRLITQFSTLIFPRSSICKKNLVMANIPVIDCGYRGEIIINFRYIMQPEDMMLVQQDGRNKFICVINQNNIYQKLDRIAQLAVFPNQDVEFEIVDKLDDTVRGANGFGSSDKK